MPRINHNIASLVTTHTLLQTEKKLEKSMERLSTGQRINYAYDDAAGYSVSERLRAEAVGLEAGNRNIQNGSALIDIAYTAMTEIEEMVNRIRELSVQMANDSYTAKDRAFAQSEVDQLIDEIERVSKNTQFNGIPLMDGEGVWSTGRGGKIHIGAGNDSNSDIFRIRLQSMNPNDLPDNTSDNLMSLRSPFDIDPDTGKKIPRIDPLTGENMPGLLETQEGASLAIGRADGAIHSINSSLASVGAYGNRLNHAQLNQESMHHSITAADSIIRDTDIAKESATLAKYDVLQKTTISVLAQANSFPRDILKLLNI